MKDTKGFDCGYYEGNRVYYSRKELSNKQIAEIHFEQQFKTKEHLFSVCFFIRDKKRQSMREGESTGRCGLEGLIWAKNKILEFEKWLIEETWRKQATKDMKIEICWADARRKRVYMWGMMKYGYRFDPYQQRIFKTIHKGKK